ncbi:MAG: PDZ domain-containing protein, partial [Akkermansiaceae bacterium]
PGFQGIGFAIPANAAKKTMQDILDRGRPIRGYLGMALANLDPYAREEFNFRENDGVRVSGVVPKSPAENADLRENDIITRYKGEKVNNLRRLISLIQQSKVGSEVTLEIWREGAIHTVTASVGEADDFNQQLSKHNQQTEPRRLDNRTILHTIGISARNPTSVERAHGTRGVVVTNILSTSKLNGKIMTGDVIRAINGRAVASRQDFYTRLVASAAVQNTELIIQRGQIKFNITLSPVRQK